MPGAGVLSGTAAGKLPERPVAAKAKTVAKGSATATAAGPVTLKLKPTGKAKKALKKGKLKAKATIEFTPTGGTKSSVTQNVTFKLKQG